MDLLNGVVLVPHIIVHLGVQFGHIQVIFYMHMWQAAGCRLHAVCQVPLHHLPTPLLHMCSHTHRMVPVT